MYNHEPSNYICPFCLIVKGVENEHVETKQSDVFYRDDSVICFIGSRWVTNNPGHVLVVPIKHIENIYDMPVELLTKIHCLEKEIAIALKAVYKCDGVSSRQHNEPSGNQDVWHYHLHVFPRYKGDNLYSSKMRISAPAERVEFSSKLREYFRNISLPEC
ncbi:MAG: HIT family protein [Clostridia bacterium]|nr:HIT family protein [Clostridia bacterium]